ncbi:hypothetical protein GGG16DRAFT_64889 [Schizophyllum commune]
MVMRMKGHNGYSPCRMCKIVGVRIPQKPNVTTHYVPLHRANHESVQSDPSATAIYDGGHLPMRSHEEMMRQATEVQFAPNTATANRLAKRYGIKGLSVLRHLSSLAFPTSFPFDFMHLIFENVVKHLISLWTGGIDGVRGDFQFEKLSVWQGVGEATEGSGRHIPSVFGARPPNCAEPKGAATADTWSFWLLYLGPVHLTKCFRRKEFYTHFVRLAELVNECLLFQSSRQQVGEIREGFIEWVNVFERYVLIELYSARY